MTAVAPPRDRTPDAMEGSTVERRWEFAAELGLLALAVGTTTGFARLFVGWEFLERLLPTVLLAWAIPLALRRAGAGVGFAMAVQGLVATAALTIQFAPGTHTLGIPSPTSVSALAAAVRDSFAEFSDLVAPVAVSDGFLVVIAAGLWVFALFADTAAMRYRGTVQAAVPYTSVFLTVGILARTGGRTAAAVGFAAGLATYSLTQRGRIALDRRWVNRVHRARGARSTATGAALLATAATAAGLIVTPLLPGGTEPVLDLRQVGSGPGSRTVVSPFVGIRSLLGPRSDQVVFTVAAQEASYWRLTALDRFDPQRDIWVSSGTYSRTDGDLTTEPGPPGRVLQQQFEVDGLGGPWLPGAYSPRWIEADTSVGFDERSSSIIRRGAADSPVSYRLESVIPDFAGELGSEPGPSASTELDPVYEEIPELDPRVLRVVEETTAGASGRVARLLALQNWFRSQFAYDEGVDYSETADPLQAFLEQRRGFCQQFSSAFALLARSMGFPSRVAVGFTPGDPSADSQPGQQLRVVRGRHAHAWPEVHLEGVGWVPFEPTPQRGDPQSVAHTGVAPAQAAPPAAAPGATETPTTAVAPRSPQTGGGNESPTDTGDSGGSGPGPSARGALVAAGLMVLAALIAAAVLVNRRGRGPVTEPAEGPRADVDRAWTRAVEALGSAGFVHSPTETPLEFAARVTPGTIAEHVAELAELRTRSGFGPQVPTAAEVEQAQNRSEQIVNALGSPASEPQPAGID
jgi:transglutaminase-like putative cysteine protease